MVLLSKITAMKAMNEKLPFDVLWLQSIAEELKMKLIMVSNKLKGASRIRKNIESQGKGGEGLEQKKREERRPCRG